MLAWSVLSLGCGGMPFGAVASQSWRAREAASPTEIAPTQEEKPDDKYKDYAVIKTIPVNLQHFLPFKLKLKKSHCYTIALLLDRGAQVAANTDIGFRFGYQGHPSDYDFVARVETTGKRTLLDCAVSASAILVSKPTGAAVGSGTARVEIRDKAVPYDDAVTGMLSLANLRGHLHVKGPRCDECKRQRQACNGTAHSREDRDDCSRQYLECAGPCD
jgi:hypothetical protein